VHVLRVFFVSQFTFLSYTGEPPVRYKSIVPKDGTMLDVLTWFSVRETGLVGVGGFFH
jgi:hypothetical protein